MTFVETLVIPGLGVREWADDKAAPTAEFAPPAGASPTLVRSADV